MLTKPRHCGPGTRVEIRSDSSECGCRIHHQLALRDKTALSPLRHQGEGSQRVLTRSKAGSVDRDAPAGGARLVQCFADVGPGEEGASGDYPRLTIDADYHLQGCCVAS